MSQYLHKAEQGNLSRLKLKAIISQPKPVVGLHIIKSLGRGGAETLLPETLHEHDREKFLFHYLYFLPWKHQMVEEIENAGGTVICFPAKNNLGIFLKLFKIVSYIKKNNIQFIHCHMPWAGVVGRMAGKIARIPVVYTEHNKWERYHKLTYLFNKWSFDSQKKVIAVSEDVAASIHKHNKKNVSVEVVQNGINTEKFSRVILLDRDIRKELNIAASTIVIGIACVFRKQKRLTTWLEVADKLHQKFPDTYFIIVGDGVLHDEVFQKAASLNMKDYLHFAGLQSEVRPYLRAMDIFMMTSEFEGLPIALLEAMSMECMPACTSAGGIGELISDGENGVLVPVENATALQHRLEEYIQQPDRIKEAGKVARNTVVNSFSMKKMVGELQDIYTNILK